MGTLEHWETWETGDEAEKEYSPNIQFGMRVDIADNEEDW